MAEPPAPRATKMLWAMRASGPGAYTGTTNFASADHVPKSSAKRATSSASPVNPSAGRNTRCVGVAASVPASAGCTATAARVPPPVQTAHSTPRSLSGTSSTDPAATGPGARRDVSVGASGAASVTRYSKVIDVRPLDIGTGTVTGTAAGS